MTVRGHIEHIRGSVPSTEDSTRRCPHLPTIKKSSTTSYSAGQPPKLRVDTLTALQEAAEYYLVDLLDDANICAVHTVSP